MSCSNHRLLSSSDSFKRPSDVVPNVSSMDSKYILFEHIGTPNITPYSLRRRETKKKEYKCANKKEWNEGRESGKSSFLSRSMKYLTRNLIHNLYTNLWRFEESQWYSKPCRRKSNSMWNSFLSPPGTWTYVYHFYNTFSHNYRPGTILRPCKHEQLCSPSTRNPASPRDTSSSLWSWNSPRFGFSTSTPGKLHGNASHSLRGAASSRGAARRFTDRASGPSGTYIPEARQIWNTMKIVLTFAQEETGCLEGFFEISSTDSRFHEWWNTFSWYRKGCKEIVFQEFL